MNKRYRLFHIIFRFLITLLLLSAQEPLRAQSNIIKDSLNLRIVQTIEFSWVVRETSGLILFQDKIWTFNDRGGEAELYGLDPKDGELLTEIELDYAENVDWEAIAMDDSCMYIADVGNNYGDRKDLCIFIIQKSDIIDDEEIELETQKIEYYYEDQVDFTSANLQTSYDCEAIITINDSIYLFTKDWLNNTSAVYVIPIIPGNYKAKKRAVLQTGGLITGADIHKSTGELVFCGYYNFEPFVIYVSHFSELFNTIPQIHKHTFPDYFGVQMEGITFIDSNTFYISAEESLAIDQSLFKVVMQK